MTTKTVSWNSPITNALRRVAVGGSLAALLVGGAWRASLLQGVVAPIRIAGESMAETFLGEHYELVCRDCRFVYRCDLASELTDERTVCPNCGCLNRGLETAPVVRGDRVLLDRGAYRRTGPRRGDCVAFRMPDDEGRLAIKRIVGLPGERVSIRQGDIWIGDRILRLTLAELRSRAILVHDNDFVPPPHKGLPPRWAAESMTTGWRARPAGFEFLAPTGTAQTDAGADWLTYRHWRCFSNPLPRTEECPVLDNYGYSQGESRQLHRVTDLLLVCRVRFGSEQARLGLRSDNGRERFEAWLAPGDGTLELLRNGLPVARRPLPSVPYARGIKLEFAVHDHRVSLAVDERTLLQHDYTPTSAPLRRSTRPFGIAAEGGRVDVRHLRILRDIYYVEPVDLGRDWSAPASLAADSYFVLGDNSPHSSDSRQDSRHGLAGQFLLGKVLAGW